MINLVPKASDALVESATKITDGISTNVFIVKNAALCAANSCTPCRTYLNFIITQIQL